MEVVIEIEGLDEYQDRLSTIPVSDFLYALMDEAWGVVQAAYATQIDVGNGDYTISIDKGTNYATLIVSGEDVGFLEFGAGIATSADSFASQVGFDVSRGSYSIQHLGQYARTGFSFWYYDGNRYGNSEDDWLVLPTFGMQKAWDLARAKVAEIVVKRIVEYLEYGK